MDILEGVIFISTLVMVFKTVLTEPLPLPKRKKLTPKFLPTPTNITVHRGELVVLRCNIEDLGPKVVVWRKKNSDIPITIGSDIYQQEDNIAIEHVKISEKVSRWDLIIKDIKVEQAGTYMCQVTASKIYSHYVTLQVLDEPIKVKPDVQLSGTEYVNAYEPIKIRCNATGATRAPEEVDWFFQGNRIVESQKRWYDRTEILNRKIGRSFVSDLLIDRSTLDDQGNYVCRSWDLKDNTIYVHVLNKKGKTRTLFPTVKLTVDKPKPGKRGSENTATFSQYDESNSKSSSASSLASRCTVPSIVYILTGVFLTLFMCNFGCFLNNLTNLYWLPRLHRQFEGHR